MLNSPLKNEYKNNKRCINLNFKPSMRNSVWYYQHTPTLPAGSQTAVCRSPGFLFTVSYITALWPTFSKCQHKPKNNSKVSLSQWNHQENPQNLHMHACTPLLSSLYLLELLAYVCTASPPLSNTCYHHTVGMYSNISHFWVSVFISKIKISQVVLKRVTHLNFCLSKYIPGWWNSSVCKVLVAKPDDFDPWNSQKGGKEMTP